MAEQEPRELTRWVPILVVVQLYLTFVVAANLLVSDYLWAGFFFLAGLVNLWAIHRGLSPKEPQHG